MALVTVNLVDVQDLKIENITKDSTIFCILQRAENFMSKETTQVAYSPNIIKFNQAFKFTISNSLIDSILVGVFQRTATEKYIPISNMKIKILALKQALSKKADKSYPLISLDNKQNGRIRIITTYAENTEDASNSFLLGGINSRVFADFDRKPAAYNHINSKYSPGQSKMKQPLKPGTNIKKLQAGPRNSNGDTINNILNDQKNKQANALMKKMKLDPARLQAMSNYIVVLNKNKELLNAAKKSGKIVDGWKVNSELDFTLMSQIENSIEETEKLIEKVKTLPVDDVRAKFGQVPQRSSSSQSKTSASSSRPSSRISNGSSRP